MHEDKFLYSRYGKANHFKVPEGYFDGLDQRVMQALSRDDQRALQPDGKKPAEVWSVSVPVRSKWVALRRTIISAAAGICVAVLALDAYLKHDNGQQASHGAAAVEAVSPDEKLSANMDMLCDYSMMDTDDMYAYMTNSR